jgi:phosphate transport system permease protein
MHLVAILLVAAGGLWFALKNINTDLRARNFIEKTIKLFLVTASLVSIVTTIGIVISILFESMKFFSQVSFFDFITGTKWSPDTAFLEGAGRSGEDVAKPEFGSVPIFAGTFMVTFIALAVAVPVGLLSAIYMSEYATPNIRKTAKPILEILAGIPTVVYGFFAAITVSPFIVRTAEAIGVQADYTNALAPGVVMGIMIIPFVSSLSDDVINAIPQNMREGSLALGTTRSETMKHVLLPAALPGIVSAILLALSRAIGETMIVVMAAGLRPNLTWNPLEGMTTVTVRIVDALTGDQSFDSLETLSAFGLGLVLLVVTLVLNIVSSIIIRKFRKQYD